MTTRLWHVYITERPKHLKPRYVAETHCPDTGWEGFGEATTEPQAVRNAVHDALRTQETRDKRLAG